MLTKRQIVCWFKWAGAGIASFEYEDRDDLRRHFVMAEEDWMDMGKPNHITITIEPGDLLND